MADYEIVEQHLGENVEWLELHGEIDVFSAPELKRRVAAVTRPGVQLVIDLTHVDYIDCTGLGVLIGTLRRVKEADGSLVIVCANTRIRRVFEVTGLVPAFDIRESWEKESK